ncbi:MAG: hypothetical protein M1600_00310 [Firmicutes bacterium]|jgi:hypothetical protein|nr:hypothetical protein [Bacillota bacterium]
MEKDDFGDFFVARFHSACEHRLAFIDEGSRNIVYVAGGAIDDRDFGPGPGRCLLTELVEESFTGFSFGALVPNDDRPLFGKISEWAKVRANGLAG